MLHHRHTPLQATGPQAAALAAPASPLNGRLHQPASHWRVGLSLLLLAALTACGGGGGESSETPPTQTTPPTAPATQATALRAQALDARTGQPLAAGAGTATTKPYTSGNTAFPLASTNVAFELLNLPQGVASIEWRFTPQGGTASSPVTQNPSNGSFTAFNHRFSSTGAWTASAALRNAQGLTVMTLNQLLWVAENPNPPPVVNGLWQSQYATIGDRTPFSSSASNGAIANGVLKLFGASPWGYYWTGHIYDLGQEFDAADFELEVQAKNPASEGGVSAYDLGFSLTNDIDQTRPTNNVYTTFMEPGAAGSYANLGANAEIRTGLSSLGVDTNTWATYKLTRKNQVIKAYFNGEERASLTLTQPAGVFRFISISSKGSATFDNVKLTVGGVLLVNETFGASPRFAANEVTPPAGSTAADPLTLLRDGVAYPGLRTPAPQTFEANPEVISGQANAYTSTWWEANSNAPKFAADTTDPSWVLQPGGWQSLDTQSMSGSMQPQTDGSVLVTGGSLGSAGALVRAFSQDLSGQLTSAKGWTLPNAAATFPAGSTASWYAFKSLEDRYRLYGQNAQGVATLEALAASPNSRSWCGLSWTHDTPLATSGSLTFGAYGSGRYELRTVHGQRVLVVTEAPASALAAAEQQQSCAAEWRTGTRPAFGEVSQQVYQGTFTAAGSISVDSNPSLNLTALNGLLAEAKLCPFSSLSPQATPGNCTPTTVFGQMQMWIEGVWQDVVSLVWKAWDGVTTTAANALTWVQYRTAGVFQPMDAPRLFTTQGTWTVQTDLQDSNGQTIAQSNGSLTVQSGSPPSVTSVSPSQVAPGQLVTFTVTGENLLSGMLFKTDACSSVSEVLAGGTSTQRQFACVGATDVFGRRGGFLSQGPSALPFSVFLKNFTVDVVSSIPTLKIPHTGITTNQCYAAGSDAPASCASPEALALNDQQDGHRVNINTMSYSAVGSYSTEECVKDNVTGLIWEGKTASGPRAGNNFYTNYDDPTQPQRYNGSAWVNPTIAEIDAATNSIGYKNYVNSIALCGYTDWRLPTMDELQSIVDYSWLVGPTINSAYFPNTVSSSYLSSSPNAAGNSGLAWIVYFNDGGAHNGGYRSSPDPVRLVRAGQ